LDLQAYLGHKNIQHTVRYTELAPNRFKDYLLSDESGSRMGSRTSSTFRWCTRPPRTLVAIVAGAGSSDLTVTALSHTIPWVWPS
jgi:hypothetical protein